MTDIPPHLHDMWRSFCKPTRCTRCGRDFVPNRDYGAFYPCRTHPRLYDGAVYPCCGATNSKSPGCTRALHEIPWLVSRYDHAVLPLDFVRCEGSHNESLVRLDGRMRERALVITNEMQADAAHETWFDHLDYGVRFRGREMSLHIPQREPAWTSTLGPISDDIYAYLDEREQAATKIAESTFQPIVIWPSLDNRRA